MAKRELLSFINMILQQDVRVTNYFVKQMEKNYGPLNKYNAIMKILEISGHGIPWIIGTASSVLLIKDSFYRRFALNAFIAIILDTSIVSGIKAVAKRRRPLTNNTDEMFATYSVDKYSFPSGHAARSAMIALLLPLQYNLMFPLPLLLMSWCFMLCVSRVLLKRHHLLDITGGAIIGFVEAILISRLTWLQGDLSKAVIKYLFGETI